MRIGELAALAEVNIQTVRFYEREGLLRAPVRTASGYRSYAESDLERLHFIRLCQGLGFTLREIQQLIHLHSNLSKYKGMAVMEPAAVKEIVEMATERLTAIDEKVRRFHGMRAELTALVEAFGSDSRDVCPVSGG
jgi:DNA-binding transcriptional MerR regulator